LGFLGCNCSSLDLLKLPLTHTTYFILTQTGTIWVKITNLKLIFNTSRGVLLQWLYPQLRGSSKILHYGPPYVKKLPKINQQHNVLHHAISQNFWAPWKIKAPIFKSHKQKDIKFQIQTSMLLVYNPFSSTTNVRWFKVGQFLLFNPMLYYGPPWISSKATSSFMSWSWRCSFTTFSQSTGKLIASQCLNCHERTGSRYLVMCWK